MYHLKAKNGTTKNCTIHLTFVEIKKDEMDRTYSESQTTILKWVLEKQILLMWTASGQTKQTVVNTVIEPNSSQISLPTE